MMSEFLPAIVLFLLLFSAGWISQIIRRKVFRFLTKYQPATIEKNSSNTKSASVLLIFSFIFALFALAYTCLVVTGIYGGFFADLFAIKAAMIVSAMLAIFSERQNNRITGRLFFAENIKSYILIESCGFMAFAVFLVAFNTTTLEGLFVPQFLGILKYLLYAAGLIMLFCAVNRQELVNHSDDRDGQRKTSGALSFMVSAMLTAVDFLLASTALIWGNYVIPTGLFVIALSIVATVLFSIKFLDGRQHLKPFFKYILPVLSAALFAFTLARSF